MGQDDWKTGRDQTLHLNIYADGSKMEGGVGAGLYCSDPEIRLSYKLPSDCIIFQAEVSWIMRKIRYEASVIVAKGDESSWFVCIGRNRVVGYCVKSLGKIPLFVHLWPKNVTSCIKSDHFFECNLRLCFRYRSNTLVTFLIFETTI